MTKIKFNVLLETIEHYKEPFIALLLDSKGEVVSIGVNQFGKNPLLHSEIQAINKFIEISNLNDLNSYTLITTAEPCSMCQSAIIWSNVGKVYYGVSRQSLIKLGWKNLTLKAEDIVKTAPDYRGILNGPNFESELLPWFERRSNGLL